MCSSPRVRCVLVFRIYTAFHCFHLAPLVSRQHGASRRRKSRGGANPPSDINVSIRPSKHSFAEADTSVLNLRVRNVLVCGISLAFTYGPCLRVVASGALCGRLLKAFCRCPGDLRAARRRRFLLFFTVSYLRIKWFDIRWQFQRHRMAILCRCFLYPRTALRGDGFGVVRFSSAKHTFNYT